MNKRLVFLGVLLASICFLYLLWEPLACAAKIRVLSGKVVAVYPVFGNKGVMGVRSKGHLYYIHTGVKTRFHPPRWPLPRDWVRVHYIIDARGYYRAYDVYIF